MEFYHRERSSDNMIFGKKKVTFIPEPRIIKVDKCYDMSGVL
jgi:hypothetical protein